ncbi:MAG: hypothetical protein CVU59_01910 [Deltaproteobacteria bacterium HGW-Deltaproteobacteria-17]|jgi:hypothetical protein|nr:MAG: hypothetical protein CVU59_01910 [Deltaproteobacteria bacterium HGW-Deltaproteobacteria-17]
MAFVALKPPVSDIFTTAFSLRRAVHHARVDERRNPESARSLVQAADRLMRIILSRDAEHRNLQMYQMNLALRSLVYDLFDSGAIGDGDADAILAHSFRFETRHLARIAAQTDWSSEGFAG